MIRILLALLLLAPVQEQPLPDRTSFLIEFQVKRPGLLKAFGATTNWALSGQYTYTETVTETTLDSKGSPKHSNTSVFEIIPTRHLGFAYRRQTVKDGVPLTQKELEKQDRKQDAEDRKLDQEIQKAVAEAKARQKANPNPTPPPQRPRAKLEDSYILMAADFQLVRREVIDGHPVIVLTFKPNLAHKPVNEIAKMLQHASGQAWVSETDYELVKLDAEVFEPISFGMGLLAKIQPGSRGLFEWRKFNDEIWLPVRDDFTARARILLVKGMNFREVHEYSNHRKYVVDVDVQFESPAEK